MTAMPGGVWAAMLTPFADDGRVNLSGIDGVVEALVAQGLDGIYLLGATGQGLALNMEERKRVAERTFQVVKGRLPVIVHVGCIATADAEELARHAAGCGAAGVSAVPPVYFPAAADAEFAHYRRIGAAGGIPFFPYVNTVLAGAMSLPPAAYIQRLLELPHIAGAKVTSHDLYLFGLLNHHAQGRLALYSGADELVCQAALSGAHGAIGSTYNLFGRECRRGRQACLDGRFEEARRFMSVFQAMVEEILAGGGFYNFLRTGMRARHGVEIGPGRTPASATGKAWGEADAKRLIARVEEATPR